MIDSDHCGDSDDSEVVDGMVLYGTGDSDHADDSHDSDDSGGTPNRTSEMDRGWKGRPGQTKRSFTLGRDS